MLTIAASASFINGGFENGTLLGWSSLGEVTASTGATYPDAGTVDPDSGSYAALLRSQDVVASTLAAQMGIDEATLEASNDGRNATNGSLIWQTVTANAGDVLQFRWNFVEQDYLPYDDWAFYGIQLNSGPTEVTKFASLGTVGPGNGTTINGWETLTVTISQTGTYTFYFGVVNVDDTGLPSDLWIDGAYAGDTPPEPTDFDVPEPATITMLLPILAGIAFRLRRGKA